MDSKEIVQNEDLQKIKNYLQNSKKNIERMKIGKKPRRKFKFIIKENKLLFTLVLIIIVTTPLLTIILNRNPLATSPYKDAITNTMETFESNFTTDSGLPVHELISENTSSELIILSTLANSILIESGLFSKKDYLLERISFIFEIIVDDSFRDYNNITKKLPVFNQFLGIYALYQAFYALEDTAFAFSFTNISRIVNTMITDFMYYSTWPYLFAVSEDTSTSYLVDQALALSVLTTHMFLTGEQKVFGWDLKEITRGMLNRIENRFYISASQSFFHKYDTATHVSSGISTSADLMFTSLGLSRTEKFSSGYAFPLSSYNLHQKVINELIDSNWLVHEVDKIDDSIHIKDQAFFTMVSYLLNLQNVGLEIENSTSTFLYSEDGFVTSLQNPIVTAESCMYGLITISSKNWAKIQNEREYAPEPRPTPTGTGTETEPPVPSASFSFVGVISAIVVIVALSRMAMKYKTRKKFGDQAEI